jgi:hypothetical protein
MRRCSRDPAQVTASAGKRVAWQAFVRLRVDALFPKKAKPQALRAGAGV